MPRFYFNVRSGRGLVEDPEGSELSGLAAARNEAILNARASMSQAILDGADISHRGIEICDEAGEVLLRVPFSEAVRRSS